MWQISIEHHQARIDAMDATPVLGRNPKEGYRRACGLQFGNVADLCNRDPVFVEAYRAARQRSLVTDDRLRNLYLLMKFHLDALQTGHIAEFGSYRGGSAIFMALVAKRLHPGLQVFAFDTFEGMPDTDATKDVHRAGDFPMDFEELSRVVAALGLDNLHLVKGLFERTAGPVLDAYGPIRLAHIDCDVYEGIETAYTALKPAMVEGGYVVFDDPLVASCLGAFEAVERLVVRGDGLHAEQVFPHLVYRYPPVPDAATAR